MSRAVALAVPEPLMVVVLRITSGPHSGLLREFEGQGSHLVGRAPHLPVSLPEDRLLSREHFRIDIQPPLCELVDLGSTNGTKVNGLRVERVRLGDGDIITAGETEITLGVPESSSGLNPVIRCQGCGIAAPEGAPLEEPTGHWLCPRCDACRKQFPPTHPDYLIEKKIGSGGMGEVYLARQLSTNRPVAIKMMTSTGAVTEKAREYFHREMTVLRDLLVPGGRCHPNIVAFYDIFEIQGQSQLIMEYVPGKNALEWLRSLDGPISISSAARIGRHLLAALDYAHAKGYVHRDVKPSNLLVVGPPQRPKAKLSDFGLAKSFRENAELVGLTTQGDVGGSVGFISPDHLRDFRDLKEPADIYSAGVTLYYLLTRSYPYLNFDPTKADACNLILEHPPVPLRAHRPDAPEALERVIAKALEKQTRERWKSAAVMAAALRPFLDGPP